MGAATETSPSFPLEKTAMKEMMGGLAFFLLIAAQVLAVIAVRSRYYRLPEESRTETRILSARSVATHRAGVTLVREERVRGPERSLRPARPRD